MNFIHVRWKTSFDRWCKAFFAKDSLIDTIVSEDFVYEIDASDQRSAISESAQTVREIKLEPLLLDGYLAKPLLKPLCLEPLLHVSAVDVKASGVFQEPFLINRPCLDLCWNITIDRYEELCLIDHQADDRCALVRGKWKFFIDNQSVALNDRPCEGEKLVVNVPKAKHSSAQTMPLESPMLLDASINVQLLQPIINSDRTKMAMGRGQQMRHFTAISDLFFMGNQGPRVAPFIEVEHAPLLIDDTLLRVANRIKLATQPRIPNQLKQAPIILKPFLTEPEIEPFGQAEKISVELPSKQQRNDLPPLALHAKRLVISTALLQHYPLIDTFPRSIELIERTGTDKLIYLDEYTVLQIAQPGDAISRFAGILIIEWYTIAGETIKLRRDSLPYACRVRVYHSSSPMHTWRFIASIATAIQVDFFDASVSMVPSAQLYLFSGSASQIQSVAIRYLLKHTSE